MRAEGGGMNKQSSYFIPPPSALILELVERETRFELATSTLARSHSTTELLPLLGGTNSTDSDMLVKCALSHSIIEVCVSPFAFAKLLFRPEIFQKFYARSRLSL